MANKNDNYYLINGDPVEAKAIYIPYKGTYYKNVKDISDMDLATIELGESFRSSLIEANPKDKLGYSYYIGKYPYSKGIKIFKPVEILQSNFKSDKIVNGFRELAEERNYNYYHDKSLEPDDKSKSLKLAYEIIETFTPEQKRTLLSSNSILGKEVKQNFYNNKHLFEEQISGYTQLRNLLINYFYIKTNHNIPTNFKLKNMQEALDNIKGLYTEDPEKIKKALLEYKEALLKAKTEEEKTQAKEKLVQSTSNNVQLNLYDLLKTDEFAFLEQKKR